MLVKLYWIVLFVAWIFVFTKIHKIYHKMFNVVYIGSNGIVKEFTVIAFLSTLLISIIFIPAGKFLGVSNSQDKNASPAVSEKVETKSDIKSNTSNNPTNNVKQTYIATETNNVKENENKIEVVITENIEKEFSNDNNNLRDESFEQNSNNTIEEYQDSNDYEETLPRKGQINSNGMSIEGFTKDYVFELGPKEVQWPVEDTWHITAYNKHESYGIVWYECWDSDDGDYYGWIDSNFILFY